MAWRGITLISTSLFILWLCHVDGSLFLEKRCPNNRTVVKDFDIQKYSGKWYEFLRTNQSYEFLGDCNTITFTAHENKTIGIKTFRFLKEQNLAEKEATYAVFTNPDLESPEGRWNISYRWKRPFFANHWIMETDYENYAITYVCLKAGPEHSIDEFTVLTRQPKIDEQLEDQITETLKQHYDFKYMMKPAHDCQEENEV